jgi:hypothetical protein
MCTFVMAVRPLGKEASAAFADQLARPCDTSERGRWEGRWTQGAQLPSSMLAIRLDHIRVVADHRSGMRRRFLVEYVCVAVIAASVPNDVAAASIAARLTSAGQQPGRERRRD